MLAHQHNCHRGCLCRWRICKESGEAPKVDRETPESRASSPLSRQAPARYLLSLRRLPRCPASNLHIVPRRSHCARWRTGTRVGWTGPECAEWAGALEYLSNDRSPPLRIEDEANRIPVRILRSLYESRRFTSHLPSMRRDSVKGMCHLASTQTITLSPFELRSVSTGARPDPSARPPGFHVRRRAHPASSRSQLEVAAYREFQLAPARVRTIPAGIAGTIVDGSSNTILPTSILVNGTITNLILPLGQHAFTIRFPGSALFQASEAQVTVRVQ